MADLLNGTTVGGNLAYHTGNLDPASFKGMNENEKANQNTLISNVARLNYLSAINDINYKGGFYEIFENSLKLSTVGQAWDIATVKLESDPTNYLSLGGNLIGFSTRENFLYACDLANNVIKRYETHVANDPRTALVSTVTSSPQTNIYDVYITEDGKKAFVLKRSSADIVQLNLDAPYDITAYTTVAAFSISNQVGTSAKSIDFSKDGRKLYVLKDNSTASIFEYNLIIPFDLKTIVYSGNSYDISVNTSLAGSMRFKPDGSRFYVLNESTNRINEYGLSSDWAITSASFTNFLSIIPLTTAERGFIINPKGTNLYLCSKSVIWKNEFISPNATDVEFQFLDSSTKSYAKAELKVMSNPADVYDITSLVLESDNDLPNSSGSYSDFFWKPDGTRLFITKSSQIQYWDFSKPFDLTSATNNVTISINSGVSGIYFTSDGLTMFISAGQWNGSSHNGRIRKYSLSTAWDVATNSLSQTYTTDSQTTFPYGLEFKPDGTKFFISGYRVIYEYALGTANDLNTVSLTRSYSVSAQQNNPFGISFSELGSTMYVSGNSTRRISQYLLATAYDLSNVTHIGDFTNLAGASNNPYAFYTYDNGERGWLLDQDGDMHVYVFGGFYGYPSTVTFSTSTIDLTNELVDNPKLVVVSSEFDLPTNTSIEINITDGSNTISVPHTNFDIEINCSSLTSRTLTATVKLNSTDNVNTPTIYNFSLYFTE